MFKFKESIFLTVVASVIFLFVASLTGCGGGGGSSVAGPAAFYVDPVAGNDSNAGTQAKPFKTLTKAISAASAVAVTQGANIYAASGVYDASTGEVFPLMPTKGENLLGSGKVLIAGHDIYNITNGDASGVQSDTTFVFASGVTATLSGISVSGVPTVATIDNATVTLSNNDFESSITDQTVTAVLVLNGSKVTLNNNTILGYRAIDAVDSATIVTARNNTFNGTYTIVTADYNDPVGNNPALASHLDFGTSSSAGSNIFAASSVVVSNFGNATDPTVMYFVGNTWLVSQQGADSSGHYAASHVAGTGVYSSTPTTGPNYYIIPTAGIQF